MKIKIILLPKKTSAPPIPCWDVASLIANIGNDNEVELIDLEKSNFHNNKYRDFLINFHNKDVYNRKKIPFIFNLMKDIGNINFDVIYFYIDWWNETLAIGLSLAWLLKKINKKIKILMSGPYLNAYGREILEHFRFIDYIAISEIEPIFNSLPEYCDCPQKIPNIIYFDTTLKKIIETKKMIPNLNNLLFPDFDFFFKKQFNSPQILPFRISRGCKYRCFFCACLTSEKLRYYRNIDNLTIKILEYKNKHKVKNFYFYDDALNFNNDYLETFLDKLIAARVNIKWSAYFIPKDLSLNLLKKIKKAGCVHIRWGIESLDKSILSKIAKNLTTSEIEKILDASSGLGISNQISLIVGFPYEKKNCIALIEKFIHDNKNILKIINVYTFKPRVGTLAYKFPDLFGIKILKDESIFKKDSVPFDELKGLKWKAKKVQQQLFFNKVNDLVKKNGLLNVDPREYFNQIVTTL